MLRNRHSQLEAGQGRAIALQKLKSKQVRGTSADIRKVPGASTLGKSVAPQQKGRKDVELQLKEAMSAAPQLKEDGPVLPQLLAAARRARISSLAAASR